MTPPREYKLKIVANHLRLIAEQMEHGVTTKQIGEIEEELDMMVAVMPTYYQGKGRNL